MTTYRMYDYLLGGKDNFEPDRIAAEKVLALVPGLRRGFELLEPGLVPKHQWRPVTGTAAAGTPNIQWGAVGRKP
ncbi:MAG: SAM-dependent methyltransferase [Streptosporangiales bacterium]